MVCLGSSSRAVAVVRAVSPWRSKPVDFSVTETDCAGVSMAKIETSFPREWQAPGVVNHYTGAKSSHK
ncbi:hypothetical protein CEXT_566851 [Caerostris extrusa]|uniref:Uncharacterized protein n=1 Tax=Caerostris extrusa TaxID=172846 RepID=A0AAV4MS32_CAEEX|nr:hypothetical protein CEXT_566851 [Caerostris extrusa]